MKISAVKSFFNKCIPTRRKNIGLHLTPFANQNHPACDTFEKRGYLDVLWGVKNDTYKSNLAVKFLRENPMNKKVYAELSPTELDALRAQLNYNLIGTAKTLVTASKVIKRIFDAKYGENQYTFVSVGRSLSALANGLGFLGVETRQIPLSECGGVFHDISKNANIMVSEGGFEDYKGFLEQTLKPQGDKKYIVCDYAYTGNSLRVFKEFLNHDKVNLGSPIEDFVGINKKFFHENADRMSRAERFAITIFEQMLTSEHFDKFAEVKSLNFKELYRISSYIYSPLQPEYPNLNRLMKFCMLDILKVGNDI